MNTNQFGKKGWTPDRIGNLNGKIYIITGTTSGTGFEAAKILLSKGAKVIMLNRNPKKAEDAITILEQELGKGLEVINIQMDLSKQATVKKAAEEISPGTSIDVDVSFPPPSNEIVLPTRSTG